MVALNFFDIGSKSFVILLGEEKKPQQTICGFLVKNGLAAPAFYSKVDKMPHPGHKFYRKTYTNGAVVGVIYSMKGLRIFREEGRHHYYYFLMARSFHISTHIHLAQAHFYARPDIW